MILSKQTASTLLETVYTSCLDTLNGPSENEVYAACTEDGTLSWYDPADPAPPPALKGYTTTSCVNLVTQPSPKPSPAPSEKPTEAPTAKPTTRMPSPSPSHDPTFAPTELNDVTFFYASYWADQLCSENLHYVLVYAEKSCLETSTSDLYLYWSFIDGNLQTSYFTDNNCANPSSTQSITEAPFSTTCIYDDSIQLYYFANVGNLPYTGQFVQSRYYE